MNPAQDTQQHSPETLIRSMFEPYKIELSKIWNNQNLSYEDKFVFSLNLLKKNVQEMWALSNSDGNQNEFSQIVTDLEKLQISSPQVNIQEMLEEAQKPLSRLWKQCESKLVNLEKSQDTQDIPEFIQKFLGDRLSSKTTPKKENSSNAQVCEVLFFPSLENEEKIIGYLKSAKKSIYVCMYTIANKNLTKPICEAHKKGLQVRVVTDAGKLQDEEKCVKTVRKIFDKGIPVKSNSGVTLKMHNKFVVIDEELVLTGSYNWAKKSTAENNENVVILSDKSAVQSYTKEFEKLWALFSFDQPSK